MKLQYFVAIGLIVVLVVWMLLPHSRTSPGDQYESEIADVDIRAVPADINTPVDAGAFIVRVTSASVENFVERVRVRGTTQATRLVNVRSETNGRVIATPVARGARVERGDVLCELAIDTRGSDLQEARSRQE